MFKLFGKKETKQIDEMIYAPVDGTCISLDDVSDKVFSSRMMGDGVAFQFDGSTLYAPMDGEIMMIAPTKHAIGMMGDNGVEILIHIGLDTVNLNGQGFDVLVKVHDKVTKGTPMVTIDHSFMKEQGMDLTTPMIITNGNNFSLSIEHINDKVNMGDAVIRTNRE